MNKTPRGIRNCNPGNIRHGDNWDGLHPYSTELDPSFCVFISPQYGIRALCKILRNYNKLYGINTIQGIINRYAPPNENDTSSYAKHVAKKLGVKPTEPVDVIHPDVMYLLLTAIILHENGIQPYSYDTLQEGMKMAGVCK
jgi:hypothetical protein